MTKSLLLILLNASFSVSVAALEMSGSPEELRKALEPDYSDVTVVGTAKKTTYSNLAHVTIVVTTKEDSISQSLSENSKSRTALVENLTAAGIPAEAIKNSKFSSSPHYGIFRGKKPSKYTVENSLRVTARSESQLLSVNRSIDSIDTAELGQIEFEVENEDQLKADLKLEAIGDAKRQSLDYGKALGLRLIPKSFSFERRRSNRGEKIEEVVVTAQRMRGSKARLQDTPTPVSVSFEQIEYRSTVEVVYESRRAAD